VAWFTTSQAGPPTGAGWFPAIGVLILCIIVGAGFQVGCNYANDYSDGIRGTDDTRTGPTRLVGSGAVGPHLVKRAAWICFAIACGAGVMVVAYAIGFFSSSWRPRSLMDGGWVTPLVLLGIGVACVLAAWFYTGGKKPYGYLGLGEFFVFVFFGLVATMGTAFVQAPRVEIVMEVRVGCPLYVRDLSWGPAIAMGVVMGLFSTAILVANNLRDLATDEVAGKRTLAVKIGDRATRILYVGLLLAASLTLVVFVFLTSWWVVVSLVGCALLISPCRRVLSGAQGRDLITVLTTTSSTQLLIAVLAGVGLGLGAFYG
jgi:1,4-dihydroxy-2-naphthoate octaprenyltransferase